MPNEELNESCQITAVSSSIKPLNRIGGGIRLSGRPQCTLPNQTGGEKQMSRRDFAMGVTGGGGKNQGGLTTLAKNFTGATKSGGILLKSAGTSQK